MLLFLLVFAVAALLPVFPGEVRAALGHTARCAKYLRNGGCTRFIVGYDLTLLLSIPPTHVPNVTSDCECMAACLAHNTTCLAYTWGRTGYNQTQRSCHYVGLVQPHVYETHSESSSERHGMMARRAHTDSESKSHHSHSHSRSHSHSHSHHSHKKTRSHSESKSDSNSRSQSHSHSRSRSISETPRLAAPGVVPPCGSRTPMGFIPDPSCISGTVFSLYGGYVLC